MNGAGSGFRRRIETGMADRRVIDAVHHATLHKVDTVAETLSGVENLAELRETAKQIKQHTLENLPHYVEQFAAACENAGGRVHYAADGEAACNIIRDIAREAGATLAVKSKSMATEEIRLNAALEADGLRVVETDLGEFIVQIDGDRPSHIVTPIIHKDRKQAAEALVRETGCEYSEDPEVLTKAARVYLRDIFRRCDFGITGANFVVAETGTVCICTNEGNGRMSSVRPRVHVALAGVEKLIPRMRDLPVFLKLLARSSTGQPLTVYKSLITGPKRSLEPDGPEQVHVVLLDNGRSELLGGPFMEALCCIRCGACLNHCPVFRNIGGHAYGGVYPGPIGSMLSPLLFGEEEYWELPRASSLCGACGEVCPVRIDIPGLLLKLREANVGRQPLSKRGMMLLWKQAVLSPWLFELSQRGLPWMLRGDEDGWTSKAPGPAGEWTRPRDLPPPPEKSFRRLWREGLKDE